MNELTRYETAKRALAEARNVDEVKDIRDKAMAMRVYAQQAKDKSLEENAIEIRFRAERRLGQMMEEQPRATGGQPYQSTGFSNNPVGKPIPLAQAGIGKNLAHRARTFSRMPEEEFEGYLKEAKTNFRTSIEKRPALPLIEDLCGVGFILNTIGNDLSKYDSRSIAVLRHACIKLIARIDQPIEEKVVCLSSK